MRFHTLVSFLFAIFLLTGCANEGVIVRKDAGPLPFYQSLGVDGSYAFLLRDNAGSMHRQLVTPEVFERYAVGQYFNDLQPVATPSSDFKEGRMERATGTRNPSRLAASPLMHKVRKTASARKATHTRPYSGQDAQVPEDDRKTDAHASSKESRPHRASARRESETERTDAVGDGRSQSLS